MGGAGQESGGQQRQGARKAGSRRERGAAESPHFESRARNATIPVGLLELILHASPEKLEAIGRIVGWKRNGANAQRERTVVVWAQAGSVQEEAQGRGGRLGRLRYEKGFKKVWLDGRVYDLETRPMARACLEYLVTQEAVDEDSARHLEGEIDPAVRQRCQLPAPHDPDSLRIQRYFDDRDGNLTRLRRELIKAAGRNGRFYLHVF